MEENKILTFGIYEGKKLSDSTIPDGYIKWLALRGSYPEPGNRFETKWKVPIDIAINARREMGRRGYNRVGDKYEKEG
jgi:uncharacterized protein (DUF3820 family)